MMKLPQHSATWTSSVRGWPLGFLLSLCMMVIGSVSFLPSVWSSPSPQDSLSYPVFVEEDLNQSRMTLRVVAISGSQNDPQGRSGLMAYMGRGVLRGTVTRPYSELQALFSQLGVEASMTPSWNQLEWTFRFPNENLSAVADLLEDLFTQPRFDARDMNEVQLQMRTELRSQFTQRQFIGEWGGANGSLVSGPFSASPLGTMEGIARLTPQDAQRAFYSQVHRGNLVVGALGSVPTDAVLAILGSRLFFAPQAPGLPSQAHQVREPMLRRGVLLDHLPIINNDSVGVTFFIPTANTTLDSEAAFRISEALLSQKLRASRVTTLSFRGRDLVLQAEESVGSLIGFAERTYAQLLSWVGGGTSSNPAELEAARQWALEMVLAGAGNPAYRLEQRLQAWIERQSLWNAVDLIQAIRDYDLSEVSGWTARNYKLESLSLALLGNIDQTDAVIRSLSFIESVEEWTPRPLSFGLESLGGLRWRSP